MKLLIPKDDAITILGQRLQEVNEYGFNAHVWKNRLILDLKLIFGELSDQWSQVDDVRLDTLVTTDKVRVLNEGKNIIAGLLRSYIQMIRQYSEISTKKLLLQKDAYANNYQTLEVKFNEVVKKYDGLIERNKNLLEQTNKLSAENRHLKSNTLQLDNVTLARLWKGIVSLPTIQFWTMIAAIAAIIGVAFWTGQIIERNSANNESFDLKNENRELKLGSEKLKVSIDSQNIVISHLNERIKKQSDSSMRVRNK